MVLTFREFHNTVKKVEEAFNENTDETIEGFFEKLEEKQVCLETVMTGDIAQMTLPLGVMRRRKPIPETVPDNSEMEKWIAANKASFKKRYGDDWEKVLYSTAEALYKK